MNRGARDALIAAVGLAAGAAAAKVLGRRPSLPGDHSLYSQQAPGARPGELRVQFLGVSTLAFDDGETAIMTDGFFTRPGMLRMIAAPVGPNVGRISGCLSRAGIDSLAAVIVGHSHYDHALDSPAVAERTSALLVGSASTRQIGLGAGLPPGQMREAVPGEPMRFGKFTVTLLLAEHAPHAKFPGAITEPLRPPARISAYRIGECYSILIDHESPSGSVRRILVQGSAGFAPDALLGHNAEVAYLGVGTLGKLGPDYQDRYWRETVTAVGARRVIPIHWDDFTRPLTEPLVPFPYFADDFDRTLRFLRQRCGAEGIDLQLPRPWIRTDPFAGLS